MAKQESRKEMPIDFLRSYGRTASRMSESDLAKLDDRLAPYEIVLNFPEDVQKEQFGIAFPKPIDPEKLFVRKGRPLVVEIGSGNGEYLFERAFKKTDTNHIGVEVYKNGLRSLVFKLEQAEIDKAPLKNVKICTEDARHLLAALPEKSVDELVILYPDPWPKKKHSKRRIVQTAFLNEVAMVLKPGGKLFMATDWADYAHWMLKTTLSHPLFTLQADCPADLGMPPSGWRATKYERKALREGRKSWYLTFARVDEELT